MKMHCVETENITENHQPKKFVVKELNKHNICQRKEKDYLAYLTLSNPKTFCRNVSITDRFKFYETKKTGGRIQKKFYSKYPKILILDLDKNVCYRRVISKICLRIGKCVNRFKHEHKRWKKKSSHEYSNPRFRGLVLYH